MPPANLLEALLAFTKLAHLTVDRRKTFAWYTDAGIRKRLRQSGVPVLQHTKGLGAHVAFSRQRTNETVTSRIDHLAALCAQLKSSRASYKTKVRALRTAGPEACLQRARQLVLVHGSTDAKPSKPSSLMG